MFAASQSQMLSLEDEILGFLDDSFEESLMFPEDQHALFEVAMSKPIVDVDTQLEKAASASTGGPESSRPPAEEGAERKRRRLRHKSSGAEASQLSQSQTGARTC